MKNGNSQELLNIKEIDESIRGFIMTLNSYEGIETAGSCSGHVQYGKARGYISFKKISQKALDFFKNFGFKIIEPNYDDNWWGVDIILEKNSSDVTEEDIKKFWVNVEKEFYEWCDGK